MTLDDVVSALDSLGILMMKDDGTYELVINYDDIKKHVERVRQKGYPQIKPECLRWTPFLSKHVMVGNSLNSAEEIKTSLIDN